MSAFWVDRPVMARKFSYQLKIATHRDNVTALLTSQYAPTTGQAYGFGLEHIADGIIHMWKDDVEAEKELRRWLIVAKMRMTNHYRRAFEVEIWPGKGLVLKRLERIKKEEAENAENEGTAEEAKEEGAAESATEEEGEEDVDTNEEEATEDAEEEGEETEEEEDEEGEGAEEDNEAQN
jgi:KaiC/GvpD/RAD55 family RecA-like ATPase